VNNRLRRIGVLVSRSGLPQEGSSSFLKKRTKKLLFSSVSTGRIRRANQWSKSFLVLFFKKELLSCCADVSVSTRVGIRGGMGERRAHHSRTPPATVVTNRKNFARRCRFENTSFVVLMPAQCGGLKSGDKRCVTRCW
jgi:hypothetical protein